MDELLMVGAVLLGAIFGSFINALSFRFGTGTSILHGRSRCMQCNHQLRALDLIPVLSYAWLRGRCRYCGSGISLQYPLVEIVAALLSLGVYLRYPTSLVEYIFWLVVWLTLLFIVVYDARHFIIPLPASLFLALLSIACVSVLFFQGLSLAGDWTLLASGPLLALPIFLLWLCSGGRLMGDGDALLELSLGWLLGLSRGGTALILAVWAGAAAGLALIAYTHLAKRRGSAGRTMSMQSEIPFAPFLALGAALVYFFHVDFFSSFALLF